MTWSGEREQREKNSIATKPPELKISFFPPNINQQGTRTKQKENLESLEAGTGSTAGTHGWISPLAKIAGSQLEQLKPTLATCLSNLDFMPSSFDQALLASWGDRMEWGSSILLGLVVQLPSASCYLSSPTKNKRERALLPECPQP